MSLLSLPFKTSILDKVNVASLNKDTDIIKISLDLAASLTVCRATYVDCKSADFSLCTLCYHYHYCIIACFLRFPERKPVFRSVQELGEVTQTIQNIQTKLEGGKEEAMAENEKGEERRENGIFQQTPAR